MEVLIVIVIVLGLAALVARANKPVQPTAPPTAWRSSPHHSQTEPARVATEENDDDDDYPCEGVLLAVTGESYSNDDGTNRQDIIRQECRHGTLITLERQPNNPYDQNAIAVRVSATGSQIGFLSRGDASWLSRDIEKGKTFSASVFRVNGDVPGKPSLGIVLHIIEVAD